MILAGGQGERLSVLSEERAKPAVPFAGKYRIIDFTLSNCVNSGLFDVVVLTQYLPRSLNEHIGIGRPWDLDRNDGGVRILQPFRGRRLGDWYRGTADAIYQNLDFVRGHPADRVVVLGGDHIYKCDYREMMAFHFAHNADLTVAVMTVPIEEAHRFGIMTLADDGRVVNFVEKPKQPEANLVSMGIYVFNKEILLRRLLEGAQDTQTQHDFGRNIVPRMVTEDRVFGYRFAGYWQDVGTVHSYWEANMDLLASPPELDLYDSEWPIYTRSEERSAAKVVRGSVVQRSLICHGCIIEGTVERSILSPGVRVGRGAVIRDSVVMTDTDVGEGAILDRVIVDKRVRVGAGARLGAGDGSAPNREQPERLNTGLTVVGKGAFVPPGAVVGRNVIIGPAVTTEDYPGYEVAGGSSVLRPPEVAA
jgi:glucose-1-phosphate adenylyltransferase